MGYEIKPTTCKCLECGDTLEYGRKDRKFCSCECKNKYNNRKTRKCKSMRIKVMNAINKNYEILDKLLKLKLTSIELSEVIMMGYKINFVTSYHKVHGHNEFWCFDIKYFMSENRLFAISRINY